MPVTIPLMLKCEQCPTETITSAIVNSAQDWDVACPGSWIVTQEVFKGEVTTPRTLAWCSSTCKEKP